MATHPRRGWIMALIIGGLVGLAGATAAMAQASIFGEFTLSEASPTATANGFTNGFLPLTNVAGRDRQGQVCTGFADANPDYVMILQQDFASLTIQVNSGGNDTTLLIQGPNDGTVRCGEDTDRRNPDARIQDSGWAAGRYRIWVGSHNQGQRYDYSLSVNP
ncbi:MAG: hypothetical protein ACFCVD_23600 [Nodosilinea sp.]